MMKIGSYEVVRLLGKGGMSEVYEVENPRLGSRHALKIYAYSGDAPDVRARFETEGRLLAKFNHPRIVRVSDIGETDDHRPYFVMDLVVSPEGAPKTLADVGDGEADEETIGRWYDDIRDGLAYIHAKGVVHRDLKLQNVMIGSDGHAVLTDFGISRVFSPEKNGLTVVDTVQTIVSIRDGSRPVMGSVGYLSPELEMGVQATPASDWYALGVIVYKLLTGTWCDSRTDVNTTLETYDPVWTRIVPKLLHSNPEGRECLSYAEEKAALRERAEAEAEVRWLKEKQRGHKARHLARYAAGLVVVLAVLLGIGYVTEKDARKKMAVKVQRLAEQPQAYPFDDLFRVPAEAKGEETSDANGNVLMPSRAQFAAAKVDALVLTQDVLSALQMGHATIEKTIADLERLRDRLDEDSDNSPFDSLEFGGEPYMQLGENKPLQMLLDGAIERLGALAEE